ncbi:MAG: FKBP-type peptidyl-prolyl cis-trans isomerase [Bacteroidetes bacterium]|nr:FKBP-type peptidyl-prolyl cis-trans isomerase [Bacteroidota bacterium]
MKSAGILFLAIALSASAGYAQKKKETKPVKSVLKTQEDTVSYSIGQDIGKNFKTQGIAINPDLLVKGLKDALAGSKALLTDAEMGQCIQEFQKELQEKRMETMNKESAMATAENKKFFDENAKNEGINTTASGLQYKVLSAGPGTGKAPAATDTVKVHYKGSLTNGQVFDSSYDRGEPIEFPLNGVIPGWTEGLQLMKEGDKFQFFIPSELGYGPRGAGGVIPPNAILIFDVELLQVK